MFSASAADPGQGRAGTCHKQALSWSLGALGTRDPVRKAGPCCVAQLIVFKPFPGSKKLRLFVEEAFTSWCKALLRGHPIVPWLLAMSSCLQKLSDSASAKQSLALGGVTGQRKGLSRYRST